MADSSDTAAKESKKDQGFVSATSPNRYNTPWVPCLRCGERRPLSTDVCARCGETRIGKKRTYVPIYSRLPSTPTVFARTIVEVELRRGLLKEIERLRDRLKTRDRLDRDSKSQLTALLSELLELLG